MQTANSGEIINDLKAERDEWQRRAERAENALPGPAETQAHANYVEGLRARAEAAMVDGWQPTHQHLKRRSLYRFVGAAKLQTSVPLSDMDAMVVYQAEDGSFWVRPDVEFYDGRFLLLAGED
ncbi:hypothetical protein EN790_33645 [Mesorhizobium sp. M2D.F.Ca.ET.147.01.1.1]|nr:hypothetical protein EN790_33645 [Mesorhizobium sp. M2D.F.Ca.ET.147.01.1.1]